MSESNPYPQGKYLAASPLDKIASQYFVETFNNV